VDGYETTAHEIFPKGSRIEKSLECGDHEEADDPTALLEQISAIENKFNTGNLQIPKEDRIANVLDKALKECGTVITVEQRSKGNKLVLEDLYDAMSQVWRTLYRDDVEAGEGEEIGLASTDSHITCYRCKKRGHKAYQCPEKPKSGGNRNNNTNNRAKERSCKPSATDVASKATGKKTFGKMTKMRTKEPRKTRRAVAPVRLAMWKSFCVVCVKTKIKMKLL
jgi:hypothetical protein